MRKRDACRVCIGCLLTLVLLLLAGCGSTQITGVHSLDSTDEEEWQMFDFLESLGEYERDRQRYLAMSTEELEQLTDDQLFEAALARTEARVDAFDSILDGANALPPAARAFYVTSYYEAEVNNGGLCQFFVNSSRHVAPILADCLEAISADDHRALFVRFAEENKINLNDLSSFDIESEYDFAEQMERYPFDEFDDAFYALDSIQDLLPDYIRAHISEF